LRSGDLNGALGRYWSSPVAADGKIILASEEGKVVVLLAAPQWEILYHDGSRPATVIAGQGGNTA